MGSVSLLKSNFNGGEISPRLEDRWALPKVQNGCRRMENFVLRPHGGTARRMGLRFIAATKTHGSQCRLVPFRFSTLQAYILEFGHNYLRFFKDGGQIVSGGAAYEIATTYSETDVTGISFTQSADVMYIVHRDHPPRKLTRTGHTSWTLTDASITANPFTGAGKYPGAVCFHGGRLWYGGTNDDPAKLWGSKSDDFDNFTTGDVDDDAIVTRLAADDVHAIRWLMSMGKTLAAGTDSGEWLISSGVSDPTITPNAIFQSLETIYGSALALPPRRLGGATLFIHRAKRKLMSLKYFFENDKYDCEDLTVIAHHITAGGIREWAWQEEPDRVLWFARADGQLVGCTYAPQHEVTGWHRHVTAGQVESVASIPAVDADELWCVVKRTIGGQIRRFIERMEAPFDTETSVVDAFFVDSGLSWSGDTETVFHGLDHLVGEEVAILADGFVVPRQTVALDGSITLSTPASRVHAGLPYRALLEPTGPDAGAADGSAQGHRKLVVAVAVDVLRSSSAQLGPSESEGDLVDMEGGAEIAAWSQPAEFYTGEMLTPFNGEWGAEVKVVIVQDRPLPFEMRSITLRLQVDD